MRMARIVEGERGRVLSEAVELVRTQRARQSR